MRSDVDKVRDWTPWVLAVLLPALVISGLGVRKDFQLQEAFNQVSEISLSQDDENIESLDGLINASSAIQQAFADVREIRNELAGESATPAADDVLDDLTYILDEISGIRDSLQSTAELGGAPDSISELARNAADAMETDDTTRVSELEDQLAQLNQGQAVRPIAPGVYGIYYGFNSSDLSFPARIGMADVLIREAPASSDIVQIAGFADRSGSELQNCELARQRVEAVADLIESLDFTFVVDKTVHGETDVPIDPEIDDKLEPANRLVMLVFPDGEGPGRQTQCTN